MQAAVMPAVKHPAVGRRDVRAGWGVERRDDARRANDVREK